MENYPDRVILRKRHTYPQLFLSKLIKSLAEMRPSSPVVYRIAKPLLFITVLRAKGSLEMPYIKAKTMKGVVANLVGFRVGHKHIYIANIPMKSGVS